jgi:hypothetical protein
MKFKQKQGNSFALLPEAYAPFDPIVDAEIYPF